jgi:hypothetical protein
MPNEASNSKTTSRPKQRWFRYSLRTFLIAITVICLWLGWKISGARQQHRIVFAVQELGGSVKYDFEPPVDDVFGKPLWPAESTWIDKLFGLDFDHDIVEVDLTNTNVTDETLQSMQRLWRLAFLDLSCSHITAQGFADLSNVKQLRELNLTQTQASDRDLQDIKSISSLILLHLSYNPITDKGLEGLEKLPHLRELDLDHTQVSADGIDRLQCLRPDLNISYYIDERK